MTCRCRECDHAGDRDHEGCNHYALADFENDEVGLRDPNATDSTVAQGREISLWRDGAVEWDGAHATRFIECPGFEWDHEHPEESATPPLILAPEAAEDLRKAIADESNEPRYNQEGPRTG